ncbi:hypothetical protein N0V90_010201 [Kalmusia sp. IMI 367209]|nr:hypothetical protein N0V90_010201 [Kalmusia sp. IMI 367209]
MPPIRTGKHVSVKKEQKYSFGRNIARLHIGNDCRVFAVHEDLLCTNSSLFREKIQPGRKDIEGECSICHEEMVIEGHELSYCATCGCNYHQECIAKWLVKWHVNAGTLRRCPLCRSVWKLAANDRVFHYPELDPSAFEMACFASHVSDQKFGDAVLEAMLEICKELDWYPGPVDISLVYGEVVTPTNIAGIVRLKKFLVQVYVNVARTHWFEEEADNAYPPGFLKDFAAAMLKRHEVKMWDLDAMKRAINSEMTSVELREEEKVDGSQDGGKAL